MVCACAAGGMTILRWGLPLNSGSKEALGLSKLVTRMGESWAPGHNVCWEVGQEQGNNVLTGFDPMA